LLAVAHCCCWTAGLLLAAGRADAARPLATDDAGVLEAKGCEAEFYGSRLRLPGLAREITGSAQLTCGLGASTQAALAYGRSSSDDPDNAGRKDSLLLAAKTQVFSGEQTSFALSAGGVMGRAVGTPFHFDSLFFNAVASTDLATGWRGHANLGWVNSHADHSQSTTWNLATEYTLREGLDAVAETYGDDRSRPWFGAGVRWQAAPGWVVGTSFAVQSDPLRERMLTLGLTAGF
jgi:hypothetical protein